MQIGLMVEPQVGGTYSQLLDLALWAEAAGIDAFARSDHYLNMDTSAHATDALATLAGLAVATSTIRLTVLVTPLTFRHPGVIAKTAATIDEMSGGRFELGIGTGWMEGEHERFGIDLGLLGRRFDRLEEALQYLWAALGRSTGGFTGDHFVLADIDVLPSAASMPIIIGGGGMKRTPTLAGRYADEYNMFVTDEETLGKRLAMMRQAATDTGRNPDDVLVSMVVNTLLGDTASDVDDMLAARAAERDMTPAEYRTLLEARNVPHGTPEKVAEQFAALAAAGVGRIYLQEFDALDAIDRAPLGTMVSILRSL